MDLQRRGMKRGLYLVIFVAAAIWYVTPPGSRADGPEHPLAHAARDQVGVTMIYDGSYQALAFPGGDVPRLRGVCSDVVIRALRDAWDLDLQVIINADMKANFNRYPANWGLTRPDRNIDHRRVPNLETLLTRAGAAQALSRDPKAFLPGDIVSFRLNGTNLPHIGIISNRVSRDGIPLVTHHIGLGAQTNNMLFDHKIVGHFRLDDSARDWLSTR